MSDLLIATVRAAKTRSRVSFVGRGGCTYNVQRSGPVDRLTRQTVLREVSEVPKKPQFFPKRSPKKLRWNLRKGRMVRQARHIYEFGPFRLIPDERQLLRDGQLVPLTDKPFDLLLALVENSGRLIKKGELME